jgi:four helix bundle protein
MKDNQLVTLSKSFAVEIIKLCDCIKARGKSNAVVSQLLRSGTSIGANIHEANYAASRADFTNKLQIALKECYESDYWLDIFKESGIITDDEYAKMFSECSKLRKLLIASITTAKRNAAGRTPE